MKVKELKCLCPKCGSGNLEHSPMVGGIESTLTQEFECEDCGALVWATYKLAKLEVVEPDDR